MLNVFGKLLMSLEQKATTFSTQLYFKINYSAFK